MTTPFIIYALPRSRTFWLSKFLSHGLWKCGHEELIHIRGLDDIKSLLTTPYYGTAETAAAPWWRLIHAMEPTTRAVIVRRPVEDVLVSLSATSLGADRTVLERQMRRLDAKLDQIASRVPNMSVHYAELDDEATCAAIHRYCTGTDMPTDWWQTISPLRLTCDLEALTRYYHAHLPQLERVGNQARQRMRAAIQSRFTVNSYNWTFQQEPFDDWLRDAQPLFRQHLVEVGECPEAWADKNLDLMRVLEQLGALYVTTARSNGRMFGYLMSVISPALDSKNGKDGIHTTFFVSPDAPGIGLKLQRASVDFLRQKGVDQVSFRAGPRGSGEKLSALFKRMGAEDAGRMFSLDLREVA